MTEFKNILLELIHLFEHLCEVERKKLQTVEKNRVTLLEDCMNEEQAAILKLRGLDSRREKCQERLGFKDKTFRQILEHITDEERADLQPIFHQLTERVTEFRELSDSAKAMIEINLHHINNIITEHQDTGSASGSITSHKV